MIGVLVMAYGGPDCLEDVEPYIMDVRNHRPTPPAVIEEMRERYARIGGRSPILERTRAQAAALERALGELAVPARVYIGMRHWRPYIGDTLHGMEADGVERAIGLVMAPHFSRMSIGAYERKARAAGTTVDLRMIESWHLLPEYIETVQARVFDALQRFPADLRNRVPLVFTAHSLPQRILAEDDPYADQLRATFEAVRARFPGHACHFAYQSAAMTPEPWLGPDAGAIIDQLAAAGGNAVLLVPIGFTSEHVEILFDIDIEYREQAAALGMQLERIAMMNDDARMMRGLARLVHEEMQNAGWL